MLKLFSKEDPTANLSITCPINFLSYGKVGIHILDSLVKSGAAVKWFPIGQTECDPVYNQLLQNIHSAAYDKDVDSLRIFHQFDLLHHTGHGRHVGWPIFELNKFRPIELEHLNGQDILIVCSTWAKEIIQANGITIPVYVVPLGVVPDVYFPKDNLVQRTGPTRFITIGKREIRKSFLEMLECFESAFTADDDVHLTVLWASLILEHTNPKEWSRWSQMFKQSKLASKITLVEWVPSDIEVANTLRASDCGLFLSKAEGFDLGCLESLACGNYNITTNYSAHTEYSTVENSYLVDVHHLEAAFDGQWFTDTSFGGEWGRFGRDQKDQTIQYMRDIHRQRQESGPLYNPDGVKTGKKFTWENSVAKLIEILK
jgi:glycosyltransferase involved in cell wall biosynthesis